MSERWNGGWGFQVDALTFKVSRENFYSWRSTRKWLIDGKASVCRVHKQRRCWWPHAWVQILGFELGAGIYVDAGPLSAPSEARS